MTLSIHNQAIGHSITIVRRKFNHKQTTGHLFIFDEKDNCIFNCHTLELPNLDNQRQISFISEGLYAAKEINHPKFNMCIQLLNVVDRSGILIHIGNYYTEIQGCILVGHNLTDINSDGIVDVVGSSVTIHKICHIMKNNFNILIK